MSSAATTERERLSACIVSLDEEDRIGRCIDSLDWCDEILVVDSHSTDRTRQIAAARGARVIERDWPGYAAQKEFAVREARHEWVLVVDADEWVPGDLRDEICRLRADGFPGPPGWSVARRSWYLGRWIGHGTWYPDRSVRLFDRRRGRFRDHPDYEIHERVEVDGSPGRFRHPLRHTPYRSLAEQMRTIDRYTSLMAEGMHRRGRTTSVTEIVVRPAADFFRFYVLKLGVLDGWQGLLLAYWTAHSARLKYSKLLALQKRLPAEPEGET